MTFCDTHAHLYLEEFDADRDAAVSRAVESGVGKILLPNIDSSSIHQMVNLSSVHPSICHPMIGLHPTSVKGNFREEMEIVEEYLEAPEYNFCAVGEIGIDLYWDKSFESQQKEAFSHQLDLAIRHKLPVAVHTRNSFDIAADIIESKRNPALRGVFHCFGGNLAQAKRAISLGFMLGIGGVITYRNSGLQQVVSAIGPEHLLLETDAPFLPPVPHRGERNESSYIPLIAAKIAKIKGIDLELVAKTTTHNALSLFDLSPSPPLLEGEGAGR
jgi:TatD DNase family protein